LIRRQVSKASMPGMAASSRIRSGITSASRPGTAQFDEAEGQPLLRRLRPEHAHDLVEEFPPRQFVRVEPHLAGLDARDVEQAIDQAQQGVAAAPGSRRRIAPVLEHGGVGLQDLLPPGTCSRALFPSAPRRCRRSHPHSLPYFARRSHLALPQHQSGQGRLPAWRRAHRPG
jgi:hypothetical protein